MVWTEVLAVGLAVSLALTVGYLLGMAEGAKHERRVQKRIDEEELQTWSLSLSDDLFTVEDCRERLRLSGHPAARWGVDARYG